MPTEGAEAVEQHRARLDAFPTRRSSSSSVTLREAAARGPRRAAPPDARGRQAVRHLDRPGGDNFFHGLADAARGRRRAALDARRGARRGHGGDRRVRPRSCATSSPRSAGRSRPPAASATSSPRQYFLGAQVDLDETYAWGFDELARLESEMRAVAAEIAGPGATVDDAVDALDADPTRRIEGKEAFRDWMQQLWPTRRSASCTAPTSTSRSRSAASRPASRRPATAASTTPARAKTSPAPAACGGRCPQGIDGVLDLARGHDRLPRGRAGPSPAGRADGRPRRAAQPLAAAAVLGAPVTARAGRSTPSG